MLGYLPDVSRSLEGNGHANVEIILAKAVVRFADDEFGRDILSKCADSGSKFDGCFGSDKLGNLIAKLLYIAVDDILPISDLCF